MNFFKIDLSDNIALSIVVWLASALLKSTSADFPLSRGTGDLFLDFKQLLKYLCSYQLKYNFGNLRFGLYKSSYLGA